MSRVPDDQQPLELTQREEIERLFAEFELAVEPRTIFDFQAHLGQAISAAEPVAFRAKDSPQRDHLRRLRLMGDGLAWRLLHPYAIRQLAKNQGGAQAVSTQAGFPATVRLAEHQTEKGHPALICDLTNCLRVGDVVVCTDPERPTILESGGHPRFKHKGRKGRQHLRAQAITQLLQSGSAQLHGYAVPTETIEIARSTEYSWATVERVALDALREGEAWAQQGSGDAVYAIRAPSGELQLPKELEDALDAYEQAMVGFVTILQKPNLRVPPVTAWPISAAARLALLQSDVFLLHAVDLGAFRGAAAGGELVTVKTKGQAVSGFEVRAAGVIHHMAPHFLDDVLLGFQSIESTRAEMVALGLAVVTSGPDGPIAESDLVSVESLEEARALLRDPERLRATGYVSMPLELFDEISAVAREGE